MDVTTGPNALARAPSDRQIPSSVPLWEAAPWIDAIAVRHGTIRDEPEREERGEVRRQNQQVLTP